MENKVIGGRYRIVEKIGTGGMAEVFKAQDEVLGRSIAIKTMLPQYATEPTFAARFRQEAQAAANLSSPYIVNIYDWGQDEGTYYIAMEYVHGIDLKSAILRRGALDQRKVAELAAQVCSALAVAHGYDIIHRDIKPHNIMVQPDGNAKVMDFGIARAGNNSLTTTDSVLGTAHYVSPEQAQGKKLTYASDLYSLGVVMYEAVTGKLPFDAPDAVAVALKQVNEAPVPPSRLNPQLDPTLEAIILHAMEKDPANRFISANDMKAALNNYLAGRPVNLGGEGETALMGTAVIGGGAAMASGRGAANQQYEYVPEGTSVLPPTGAGYQNFGAEPFDEMPERSYGRNGSRSRSGYGEDPYTRGGGRGGSRQYGHLEDEPPKKKWPLVAGIVAAVAVIAIIIAVVAISNCSGNAGTAVPSVTGMTQTQAEKAITDAGFVVGEVKQDNSASVAAGNVISQDPAGKTKAEEGSKVNLVVSSGPAEAKKTVVPDLTGKTQTEAEALLKTANLVGKAASPEHDKTDAGKIFKQDPVANSSVPEGSTVTFTVSLGEDTVEIPKVIGMTQSTATTTLTDKGFVVSVSEDFSDSVANGEVISQDPEAGQKIVKGQTVNIVVSKGPKPIEQVTVPNVIGKTYEEAKSMLVNLGLAINVTYVTDEFGDDLISEQSPVEGTKVDPGTEVKVKIPEKPAQEE